MIVELVLPLVRKEQYSQIFDTTNTFFGKIQFFFFSKTAFFHAWGLYKSFEKEYNKVHFSKFNTSHVSKDRKFSRQDQWITLKDTPPLLVLDKKIGPKARELRLRPIRVSLEMTYVIRNLFNMPAKEGRVSCLNLDESLCCRYDEDKKKWTY